ncbi:MAG: ribonuclease G [Rhodobacteraceae bacterium]|nr:ribonuclease G [Paracoccaceae bacterium]
MKGLTVATGSVDGRKAAARVVDGRLEDLIADPDPAAVPLPGTVFRGVAERPAKGLGGQFVRLAGDLKGFLRHGQIGAGQSGLVQVTGFAEPGKAVPVTSKLLFKGRYVIVTPGTPGVNVSRRIRDEHVRAALTMLAASTAPGAKGVILRSSCAEAEDTDIAGELHQLHELAEQVSGDTGTGPERLLDGPDAHELAWLEWADTDAAPEGFAEHGVEEMIDQMRHASTDLPQGASAWIEPTRALVAVDVNTGGDGAPAAGLRANIALARDLPRQLRCRGLGGQIVVDFAPFPKKDRRQIEQVLRSAFKTDPVETALVGWTPLGHFELQRKRERWPL